MKKIRALWIITNGIRKNGICVSQLDYLKNMDKNKFKIDIIAYSGDSQKMIEEYKSTGNNVYVLPNRTKELFKYVNELKKLIKNNKYDIVHVHGSSSLMAIELNIAKKCNVKVRIAHSRNTQTEHPILNSLLKNMFKSSYNHAMACGKDAGKWLFGNEKIQIFHNGKDLEKYKFNDVERIKIREKYNLNNKIAFGHVGLFNKQKNHEFLINAFYKYHQANKESVLILMGSGVLEDKIRKQVKDLNLENNVIFLGTVDNVAEIINGLDCMIFPSLFEGLPNVVIEWQASGINCIISDQITEECQVTDFCKMLPLEEEKWIEEMKKIKILDNEKRKKQSIMGLNSLIKNKFELYTNAKELQDYYIKWLGEK